MYTQSVWTTGLLPRPIALARNGWLILRSKKCSGGRSLCLRFNLLCVWMCCWIGLGVGIGVWWVPLLSVHGEAALRQAKLWNMSLATLLLPVRSRELLSRMGTWLEFIGAHYHIQEVPTWPMCEKRVEAHVRFTPLDVLGIWRALCTMRWSGQTPQSLVWVACPPRCIRTLFVMRVPWASGGVPSLERVPTKPGLVSTVVRWHPTTFHGSRQRRTVSGAKSMIVLLEVSGCWWSADNVGRTRKGIMWCGRHGLCCSICVVFCEAALPSRPDFSYALLFASCITLKIDGCQSNRISPRKPAEELRASASVLHVPDPDTSWRPGNRAFNASWYCCVPRCPCPGQSRTSRGTQHSCDDGGLQCRPLRGRSPKETKAIHTQRSWASATSDDATEDGGACKTYQSRDGTQCPEEHEQSLHRGQAAKDYFRPNARCGAPRFAGVSDPRSCSRHTGRIRNHPQATRGNWTHPSERRQKRKLCAAWCVTNCTSKVTTTVWVTDSWLQCRTSIHASVERQGFGSNQAIRGCNKKSAPLSNRVDAIEAGLVVVVSLKAERQQTYWSTFVVPKSTVSKHSLGGLGSVTPCQLRHVGALYKCATSKRTILKVYRKGRWTAPQTVRRYEKPVRVSEQLQRPPHAAQKFAAESYKQGPKVLSDFCSSQQRHWWLNCFRVMDVLVNLSVSWVAGVCAVIFAVSHAMIWRSQSRDNCSLIGLELVKSGECISVTF